MAQWHERAEEGSFRPVEGGYVFQPPTAWILGRPRYVVVDEAQKAVVAARLRRWRGLVIAFVAISFVLVGAIMATLLLAPATLSRPSLLGLLIVVTLSLFLPLVLVPQMYLMRALHQLPPRPGRIMVREQLAKIAVSVSGKLLVTGLVAGLTTAAISLLMLIDAWQAGRLAQKVFLLGSSVMTGTLLAGYFGYLVALRARLTH